MPLLARRLSIGFKHSVHEVDRSLQLPSRPFGLLPRLRQRASDRLAHHAPMHTQFLGHPSNRAYAELVLSTELFEQLHFGSPVQRVSSASGFARIRVPVRQSGGPKQSAELGQIRIPKSDQEPADQQAPVQVCVEVASTTRTSRPGTAADYRVQS